MRVVVKTNNLSREEWLKYRTGGIGGSDVSVIAGINPYRSLHQLWLEKTGQISPEETDNEYTHFGTLLEPIVRQEFVERTGLKVRQKHMLLQSEEFPFMYADLDGVINDNGETAIFEAKTASQYKAETWENGVPAGYILQVQHYMAVTGAQKTYIAALIGGNHFVYHVIERDVTMIAKIIAMENHFWKHNVIGGVEPIPDGSDATTEYLNQKYAVSNGKTIDLPQEAIAICEEYERLANQLKEVENAKNSAANQIKNYMKEAEVGRVGNKCISWKQIVKSTVDTKKLKEEQPELYSNYLMQNSYRRLTVA